MKRILTYCSLFSFLIAGCEKDAGPTPFDCPFVTHQLALMQPGANTAPGYSPAYPCDYAKAEKNGILWIAHASTFFTEESDTLNIAARGNEENLIIRLVFAGTGSYRILPASQGPYFDDNAYFYTTVGGDVITGHYHLLEEGLVEILEYNESEKTIKGTFHLSLMDNRTPPDLKTMLFTNGNFSVHLPD